LMKIISSQNNDSNCNYILEGNDNDESFKRVWNKRRFKI